MPTRVRIARMLLLMWGALYVAHRLGIGGPPLGADAFEALIAPFDF